MKNIQTALIATLLLAACSNSMQQQSEDGQLASSAIGAAQSTVVADAAPKSFYAPLSGFELDIPFHFRSDKIYKKPDSGQLRRAIILEYLTGDAAASYEATLAALTKAGYKPKGEREVDAKGTIKQQFVGRGGLYLEVSQDAGTYPSHPKATGLISASWPIKSTSDPSPFGQN